MEVIGVTHAQRETLIEVTLKSKKLGEIV